MKIKLTILLSLFIFAINAYGQKTRVIINADSNDYIDCAAFYSSVAASLKTLGAEKDKVEDLVEKSRFFLKTAIIYNEPKMLASELKQRFLVKNKKFTTSAFKMLKDSDKEIYPKYIDSKISDCKDMLNINMSVLTEKQGIKVK